MGTRPTTHVWEETPAVKAGDTIKLIDKLTPEERAAVRKIRDLGETKVLDIKAQLLEEAATAARAHANASKLIDNNSWLEATHDYEPRHVWPGWAIACAVAFLAVAVFALAVRGGHRSTLLPSASAEAPLETPGEPVEAPSTRKGGVAPSSASKVISR